jgi:hypothetical protein
LREIAVFGGTAHSALSAGSCADLGVRCAAKPLAVPNWHLTETSRICDEPKPGIVAVVAALS